MISKSWSFRLYILFGIGWAAWFGYQAHDANRQYTTASEYLEIYAYDKRAGRTSAYDFHDLVMWQIVEGRRLKAAMKTLAGGLLVGGIAMLGLGWVGNR